MGKHGERFRRPRAHVARCIPAMSRFRPGAKENAQGIHTERTSKDRAMVSQRRTTAGGIAGSWGEGCGKTAEEAEATQLGMRRNYRQSPNGHILLIILLVLRIPGPLQRSRRCPPARCVLLPSILAQAACASCDNDELSWARVATSVH